MTFKVSLLIDADGKAAVQEVRRVEKAQKDAAKASDELGRKGKTAAAGVSTLGQSAGVAETQIDLMADANRRASGSMGNLVAQGNDVAMMLMAGQDPMMLAIQQGTQINQVWGQMGVKGTGAFKAIGGALMSMISPINLITIGSIAAAGAMVQWFTSGQEAAKTFEDRLSDLSNSVDAYSGYAKLAASDTSELEAKFGHAGRQARSLAGTLRNASRDDALTSMKAAVQEIGSELGELGSSLKVIHNLRDLALSSPEASADLRFWIEGLNRDFGLTLDQAEKIEKAFADVSGARGPQEGVAAAVQLNVALLEVYGSAEKIPDAFRSANTEAAKLALKVAEISAVDTDGLPTGQREAMQQYYESRVRGEEYLKNARALETAERMEIYRVYTQTRIESDANLASAQAMLGALNDQAELQQLIALYGADSAEVTEYQAAAERDVLAQKLQTLGVAESVQQQVLAAYDNIVSNEIATANWAATMSGVAAEVRGILSALSSIGGGIISNASKKIEIEALKAGKSVADARMASATSQIEMEYRKRDAAAGNWFDKAAAWADKEVSLNGLKLTRELSEERAAAAKREALANRKGRAASGGRGGSSRPSSTDREREAVGKLILSLEDQLAILRETDPIQKEMLRNREALKAATDAERDAVRGLIEEQQNEELAMERKQDLTEYLKDSGYDLFTSLAKGGDAATQALLRLADAFAEAAFQAILLGEGPLAGILGSGGGLLTNAATAAVGAITGGAGIPAKAAGGMVGGPPPLRAAARPSEWRSIEHRAVGGMIYGKGGGTSDDNLTWTSNGEYIVNAKSTARNRGLLERINAGAEFPAMAAGGGVGDGSVGGGGAMQIAFMVENNSSAPVTGAVQEVQSPGGGRSFKMVLADTVGTALATPGGGARRQLQKGFGLKPRGTKR